MQIAKRAWLAVALAAALAVALSGPVPAFAREYNVAQGRVLLLDAAAQQIIIRTAQGSQLQCTYNGETRVVGAGGDVAALRAMSQVTVYYSREEMEYVATEIEVHQHPF